MKKSDILPVYKVANSCLLIRNGAESEYGIIAHIVGFYRYLFCTNILKYLK